MILHFSSDTQHFDWTFCGRLGNDAWSRRRHGRQLWAYDGDFSMYLLIGLDEKMRS